MAMATAFRCRPFYTRGSLVCMFVRTPPHFFSLHRVLSFLRKVRRSVRPNTHELSRSPGASTKLGALRIIAGVAVRSGSGRTAYLGDLHT